MAGATYQEIRTSLKRLYLEDPRPWLVGFSGASVTDPNPWGGDNRPLYKLYANGDEPMDSEIMSDWKETNRVRELQEEIAALQRLKKSLMLNLLTGRIRLPVGKEGKP